MIKGLILSGWVKSKEATIAFVMAAIIFWGVLQVIDRMKDLGPSAVTAAIEEKLNKRIMEAEDRSKQYVDQKTLHGEQLVEVKHKEMMGAVVAVKDSVSEVKADVKTLNQNMLNLLNRLPRSSASIGGKPCNNGSECL